MSRLWIPTPSPHHHPFPGVPGALCPLGTEMFCSGLPFPSGFLPPMGFVTTGLVTSACILLCFSTWKWLIIVAFSLIRIYFVGSSHQLTFVTYFPCHFVLRWTWPQGSSQVCISPVCLSVVPSSPQWSPGGVGGAPGTLPAAVALQPPLQPPLAGSPTLLQATKHTCFCSAACSRLEAYVGLLPSPLMVTLTSEGEAVP